MLSLLAFYFLLEAIWFFSREESLAAVGITATTREKQAELELITMNKTDTTPMDIFVVVWLGVFFLILIALVCSFMMGPDQKSQSASLFTALAIIVPHLKYFVNCRSDGMSLAESLYGYIMIPVVLACWAITILRALLNVMHFIVNRFITFTIRT